MSTVVYVGLGSNLANPVDQVNQALTALDGMAHCRLLSQSSLYRSAPMGPQDQNDYINAVAELSTDLTPIALLDALQSIENQQGRVRKDERWGPRTLDLDLLLYGDKSVDLPRLKVPHYGMKQRNFVLLPLQEIAPDLVLPGGEPLSACVAAISSAGIEKLT